jgi:hypothetical protein
MKKKKKILLSYIAYKNIKIIQEMHASSCILWLQSKPFSFADEIEIA